MTTVKMTRRAGGVRRTDIFAANKQTMFGLLLIFTPKHVEHTGLEHEGSRTSHVMSETVSRGATPGMLSQSKQVQHNSQFGIIMLLYSEVNSLANVADGLN